MTVTDGNDKGRRLPLVTQAMWNEADAMAAQKLPDDDPRIIAWEAYKNGPDYQNTRNWALHEKAVDGSLWSAFIAGWTAMHKAAPLSEDVEGMTTVAAWNARTPLAMQNTVSVPDGGDTEQNAASPQQEAGNDG